MKNSLKLDDLRVAHTLSDTQNKVMSWSTSECIVNNNNTYITMKGLSDLH